MVEKMTVRDLIEELEQMPMDLPVINDVQEITEVELVDNTYFLDGSFDGYSSCPAVVLR